MATTSILTTATLASIVNSITQIKLCSCTPTLKGLLSGSTDLAPKLTTNVAILAYKSLAIATIRAIGTAKERNDVLHYLNA